MGGTMRQVVLRAYAQGVPRVEDFALESVALPAPAPGQILLRTIWLSLDPLIRFALDEKPITGRAHVGLGEVVYGGAVSEVVESNHPDYAVGDFVEGRTGWREYAALDPKSVPLRKIDPAAAPLSTALGALGMPGQTAHCCMIEVGKVTVGETVVISAASGAVGTLAGQIGKILGARVVGIAGGAQKCAAVKALGFDECVDYRAPDYAAQLAAAVPGGVDVYIENVGGAVTEAVLPLLKYRSRMIVCGFIAHYGVGREGPGPDKLPGFLRTIMSKGLEVRGFGGIVAAGPEALTDMAGWIKDGRLRHPEAVFEGLEAAPAAFAGMFGANANVGKLLVKIGAG